MPPGRGIDRRRIVYVAGGERRDAVDADGTTSLMIDWLVIGGGPHGVHTALRLIGEGEAPRDAVRILDDEQRLLARWRRSTRNTGMRFLRSPSVHHIGLSSASLDRFAKGRGRRVDRPFTRPYFRPALDLFDLHCDDLIERYQLQTLHVRGRVNRLDLTAAGAQGDGGREARRAGADHDGLDVGPDHAARARAASVKAHTPSTGVSGRQP